MPISKAENQTRSPRRVRKSAVKTYALTGILAGMIGLTASAGSGMAAPVPNNDLLGSYLAGRYASAINNSRMASEYYLRALESDPTNKDLLERAFSSVVADGRYDDAVKLAKKLEDNGITRGIARLVLLSADIRAKHFDAAEYIAAGADEAKLHLLIRHQINTLDCHIE